MNKYIVTIFYNTEYYYIKGYDLSENGHRISFRHDCFRPLDEIFATSITSAIEEEMSELTKVIERELIKENI